MKQRFRFLVLALVLLAQAAVLTSCSLPGKGKSRIGAITNDYELEKKLAWVELYSSAKRYLLAIDTARAKVDQHHMEWALWEEMAPRMAMFGDGATAYAPEFWVDYSTLVHDIHEARIGFKVELLRYEATFQRIVLRYAKDFNIVEEFDFERAEIRKSFGDEEMERTINVAMKLLPETALIVSEVIQGSNGENAVATRVTHLVYD